MNWKKTFSVKHSIFILVGLALFSLVGFLIVQNKINNLEEETIKREIEVKHLTERLLFDLRETLTSDLDRETKTAESLKILNDIRSILDSEYIYLRIEAQQKINIINDRLDEIEKAILEDPNSAVALVDKLIKDLQNSENLADFDKPDDNSENNSNNDDNTYDPDYSDANGDNADNQNNDSKDQAGEDSEGQVITPEKNPFSEDFGDDSYYDKEGVKPKVDRNKSENLDDGYVELKIGN